MTDYYFKYVICAILILFILAGLGVIAGRNELRKFELTTEPESQVTAELKTVATTTTTTTVPTMVETTTETTTADTTTQAKTMSEETIVTPKNKYTPSQFRRDGVIYYDGWTFTWYSERVLPGGGLSIPGRWSDGNFVRDRDGYIVIASSDLQQGTVIDTPFGEGKVYDSGCASGVIDVYVSW